MHQNTGNHIYQIQNCVASLSSRLVKVCSHVALRWLWRKMWPSLSWKLPIPALRPSVELVHGSDFYKCYWWRMFSEATRDACGALITQTGDVLQRRSGRSFPVIYLQCANGPVTLQWRRLLTFTARNGAHSELKWRENKKRFILRAAAATLLDWDQ